MTYRAPLDEVRFLLGDVLDYDGVVHALPAHRDAPLEAALEVLAATEQFCVGELAPLNAIGDRDGCVLSPDGVRTPPGFREAYARYVEAGWPGLSLPPEHGGAGLPQTVQAVHKEILCATNLAFSTYPSLTQGAARTIDRHGDDGQRRRLLPPLVTGRSTGTMCLTEPQAGTDLGLLRSRAEPDGDGYRLTGQKIFITAGEHDLVDDTLHLVLARLPEAPPGTRGISLFAVPRRLAGERNGVTCVALEHKMGIRGSATCTLDFAGARGELIGEPHRGLSAMFTMMNSSRLSVGIQGLAIAEAALQRATAYARERLQGRALDGARRPDLPADPIIAHADVRRLLGTTRARVEAGRALYLWAATRLDVSLRHPDATVRAAADDTVALLTPVIKAGLTDLGFEAAATAQAIFGGAGYIVESGIEQLVRDVRITQIYEGTNAVQALDLALRKIQLDDGRLVADVAATARGWLADAGSGGALVPAVTAAAEALDLLESTTRRLVARMPGDREGVAAGATDYLRLFLLATESALLVRLAAVATACDAPHADARIATALLHAERVLPATAGLARSACAGAGSLATPLPEALA